MAGEEARRQWRVGASLVCLALAGATFAAVAESTTELAFDDGTAEAGRASAIAGGGFAVRFTLAPGDMLLRVRMHITGLRGGITPIEVHVWDEDRKDMMPALLATPTAEGWFDVDISSARLVPTGEVYVGYVQTSAENHPWLGIDTTSMSDRSFGVMDWVPVLPAGACAMIRVLAQHVLAPAEDLELAYDDGTAETGRGYAMAGAGYAVRFTPPPGAATLAAARFFVAGFSRDPAPIEVCVWSADGEPLIPPLAALPTEEGWFDVDLSAAALRFTDDFCVGYLQTDALNYPWLGVDTGTPNDRSYSVPDWTLLLPSGANAMIRVRFADE